MTPTLYLLPALALALVVIWVAVAARTAEQEARRWRDVATDARHALARSETADMRAYCRRTIADAEVRAAECDARARRLWAMLGRW